MVRPAVSRRVAMIEHFQRLNAPEFKGIEGPEEAEQFIVGAEKIFQLLGNTDEEKVALAEYQLKGIAEVWYRTAKRRMALQPGDSAWERFKSLFMERFFPEAIRRARAREFEVLVQGRLTFEQYGQEYVRLSAYAPHLVATEDMMARRFEYGANMPMREQLTALRFPTFDEVLSRGLLMEATRNRGDNPGSSGIVNRPVQRRFGGYHRGGSSHSQGPRKRGAFTGAGGRPTFGGGSVWRSPPNCNKCGRNHAGPVCFRDTFTCFECGQPGHIRKYCPVRRGEHLPRYDLYRGEQVRK